MTETNAIVRYAEALVPKSSKAHVAGSAMGALGGAVFMAWSYSTFTAKGCKFVENSARGARILNWGGALNALGGTVELEETIAYRNTVVGGLHSALGGFLCATFAMVLISNSELIGNEAWGRSTAIFAGGGAVLVRVGSGLSSFQGTLFERNMVRDGLRSSIGGAINAAEGTTLELVDCSLRFNTVLSSQISDGGAIRADPGANVTIGRTTFSSNAARDGTKDSSGGSIHIDGAVVTLKAGVVFATNVAFGNSLVMGGAIAITGLSAQLTAADVLFVNNSAEGSLPTGGAISAALGSDVTICGGVFTGNSVNTMSDRGRGGAVFVEQAIVRIKGSRIHGNIARISSTTERTMPRAAVLPLTRRGFSSLQTPNCRRIRLAELGCTIRMVRCRWQVQYTTTSVQPISTVWMAQCFWNVVYFRPPPMMPLLSRACLMKAPGGWLEHHLQTPS